MIANEMNDMMNKMDFHLLDLVEISEFSDIYNEFNLNLLQFKKWHFI